MHRSKFVPYVNAEMIQQARACGGSPVEVSLLYLIRGVDELVQQQSIHIEEGRKRRKEADDLQKKLAEKNKLIKELLKQTATLTKTLNKLGRVVQGKTWQEIQVEDSF